MRAAIRRASEDRKSVQEERPDRVADLLEEAADEIEKYDRSFDIRWEADMRAIKLWQEANPGNDLMWPDHADLCVWLMEELERYKKFVETPLDRYDIGKILHDAVEGLEQDREWVAKLALVAVQTQKHIAQKIVTDRALTNLARLGQEIDNYPKEDNDG